MKLKPKYIYAGRWSVSDQDRRPISTTSYDIYLGEENREGLEEHLTWLNGRQVIIKTIKYPNLVTQDDIVRRRQAFERQLEVLALPHFMIPEPLDYCSVTNHHTPELANTDLGSSEPMLVYAYSPGETLRDAVAGRRGTVRPFAPLEALDLVRRIITFLDYLHEEGFGHIAVNPDHFLYDKGSLRALGLSKIVPINRTTGRFAPYERPVFPPHERVYVPSTAIINDEYGYDTESYGLGMLLFFLLSGRCPSTIKRPGPDGLPRDQIEALSVCPEVKLLIAGLTSTQRFTSDPQVMQVLRSRFDTVIELQAAFEETSQLRGCKVGIFADLENMMAAFRPRRGSEASSDGQRSGPRELALDLEALASAYTSYGPTHKVVVLGRHNIKGLAQKAVAQLQRSGWRVIAVDSTVGDNGKIRMGEVDDSVLINAGNIFLEAARPEQFVLVSNDSDYQQLLEKARMKGCRVTLVYGSARGRVAVSGEYLRQLTARQIQVRYIGTYPFVFSQETNVLFATLQLRVSPDRAASYKLIVWEFARQFGYERGQQLLRSIKLFQLEEFPPEQMPWIATVVGRAQQPQMMVDRLYQRRRPLAAFAGAPPQVLDDLLELTSRRDGKLEMLADVPDLTLSEWPFIKANLGNLNLLRFFVQQGKENEDIRAMIKAAPDDMQALLRNHPPGLLINILHSFGPPGLAVVRQHGPQAVALLRQYGTEALHMLLGPNAQTFKTMLTEDAGRRWIELWYERTETLSVVDMLVAEPRLRDVVRRAGVGAFVVYQATHSIEAVEQARALASILFKDIEIADGVRRELVRISADVTRLIDHLQANRQQTDEIFRRADRVEDLPELVRAVDAALVDGVVRDLGEAYRRLGIPMIEAYRRYGIGIFDLIRRIDYRVVNLLNLFPDALPDLQRYGQPAYQFIREFQEVGQAALVRLRGHNLRPLFDNPAQLDAIRVWYRDHKDLRVVDWLLHEPALVQALQAHGGVVLELYAADQDLALIQDAMVAVQTTGVSVQETYRLLRVASAIPRADLLRILEQRRALIFSVSNPQEQAQFARALYNAEILGVLERLDRLIDEVGSPAIRVFERHALALFTVLQATEPAAVLVIDTHPSVFTDFERYGQAAYRLVKRFGVTAVTTFARLRTADLLPLISDQTALGILDLWHQKTGDLAALDVLVEQPDLVTWVRRYTALISQGSQGSDISLSQGAVAMVERYARDRSQQTMAVAINLAEKGYLDFLAVYDLLHEVQRPTDNIAAIIAAHSSRLRRLDALVDRVALVRLLHDARQQNLEQQVEVALDGNDRATLLAYIAGGKQAIELLQQIEPQVLHLVGATPGLLVPFRRYGASAYLFACQFGPDGIQALLQFQKTDLSNVLSETLHPTIARYRQTYPQDFAILKVLAVDWEARQFFDRYPVARVMACWLQLREQQPTTLPSAMFSMYEEVLFHTAVDIKRLTPLVWHVPSKPLKDVVTSYADTLFAYTQISDQVRVCKLLTGALASNGGAGRFAALVATADRAGLLTVVERGGGVAMTLLERLQGPVRTVGLNRLHKLEQGDLKTFVDRLLSAGESFGTASLQTQEGVFRASEIIPLDRVLAVYQKYGEEGVSHIVKTGKDVNWLFKITHWRR